MVERQFPRLSELRPLLQFKRPEFDATKRRLDAALTISQPEIFNTDQGTQFTSLAFIGRLLARDIQISMDGRGRALDNAFIERLWRTVKYEEVYLQEYEDVYNRRIQDITDPESRSRLVQRLLSDTPTPLSAF